MLDADIYFSSSPAMEYEVRGKYQHSEWIGRGMYESLQHAQEHVKWLFKKKQCDRIRILVHLKKVYTYAEYTKPPYHA
jgi:hypothetical protein